MSINYRQVTAGRPTFPFNIQDAKRAVPGLRKNAARLQIDPQHIGAIGVRWRTPHGTAGGERT